jgi:hypothetical protein
MILGSNGGSQGGVSSGYNSANASSSSATAAEGLRSNSFKAANGSNSSSSGSGRGPVGAGAITPQQQSEDAAEACEPIGDKNGAGVTIVEVQQGNAGPPEAQEVPGVQISRPADEQVKILAVGGRCWLAHGCTSPG